MNAPVLDAAPAETFVSVASNLLGPLRVSSAQVFGFAAGVCGFPEARAFALLATTRPGVYWFQSLDHEVLTFLLADPFCFVEGYSVELGPLELGPLHPVLPNELAVFCILTLPGEGRPAATLNLQGPLALNATRREGRQVVLADCAFGTRHPVDLDDRRAERV